MQAGHPERKLYKARRPDGETAWVDHEELWRLQQGQAEEARRKQARRRGIAVAALIGLVALALAAVVYRLRSPAVAPAPAAAPAAVAAESESPAAVLEPESLAVGPAATAAPAAAPGAGSPPPLPGTAADLGRPPSPKSAAAPEPVAAPTEQVESAVRAWADAWAGRDVPAYLASYADGFDPPDGLTRPEWASQRRRRLLDRTWIRLEIEELEIELRDAGRAEARFRQTYSSPSYSDVVRKTLELIEDGGGWLIVAERAAAP